MRKSQQRNKDRRREKVTTADMSQEEDKRRSVFTNPYPIHYLYDTSPPHLLVPPSCFSQLMPSSDGTNWRLMVRHY